MDNLDEHFPGPDCFDGTCTKCGWGLLCSHFPATTTMVSVNIYEEVSETAAGDPWSHMELVEKRMTVAALVDLVRQKTARFITHTTISG